MSLDGALKNFEAVVRDASATAETIEDLVNIPRALWESWGEYAAEVVQKDVRGMFVTNYRKSGMKVNTGKMLKAVQNANVRFSWKGKAPKLVIAMPAGMTGYEENGKSSNFYKVAASNNYGAVRTTGDFKQKAKKKIKTKLLSGKSVFVKGHTFKAGKDKRKSVSLGGGQSVIIVQPKTFFALDSSQKAFVDKKFYMIVHKEARQYVGL